MNSGSKTFPSLLPKYMAERPPEPGSRVWVAVSFCSAIRLVWVSRQGGCDEGDGRREVVPAMTDDQSSCFRLCEFSQLTFEFPSCLFEGFDFPGVECCGCRSCCRGGGCHCLF